MKITIKAIRIGQGIATETPEQTKVKAMLYPNVTVLNGGTFNETEHDGLINGATFTDYYNLAKN